MGGRSGENWRFSNQKIECGWILCINSFRVARGLYHLVRKCAGAGVDLVKIGDAQRGLLGLVGFSKV